MRKKAVAEFRSINMNYELTDEHTTMRARSHIVGRSDARSENYMRIFSFCRFSNVVRGFLRWKRKSLGRTCVFGDL